MYELGIYSYYPEYQPCSEHPANIQLILLGEKHIGTYIYHCFYNKNYKLKWWLVRFIEMSLVGLTVLYQWNGFRRNIYLLKHNN